MGGFSIAVSNTCSGDLNGHSKHILGGGGPEPKEQRILHKVAPVLGVAEYEFVLY